MGVLPTIKGLSFTAVAEAAFGGAVQRIDRPVLEASARAPPCTFRRGAARMVCRSVMMTPRMFADEKALRAAARGNIVPHCVSYVAGVF